MSAADPPKQQSYDDVSEESSSSEEEEEDDDLALDGELVRADPDQPAAKRSKKMDDDDDEDVPAAPLNVDFVFCDLAERFFHGISQFLNYTNAIVRNSLVADAMIASTVGSVISTSADQEDEESNGNVYGYASILVPSSSAVSIGTAKHQTKDEDAVSPATACAKLIQYCQTHAPKNRAIHNRKLYFNDDIGSSKTIAVLSHARMMNLPLELVPVLHQQLLLDLDYAIEHHNDQDDDPATAVDVRSVSHLIRIAPCCCDGIDVKQKKTGDVIYKFFDDESLADAADDSFAVENGTLRVILISLENYRKVVTDLARMFPSA